MLAAIYYYVTLPAINIHSSDFWMFFIVIIIIAALIYIRRKKLNRYELKNSKGVKVILGMLVVVVAALLSDWHIAIFTNCKCEEVSETSGCKRR